MTQRTTASPSYVASPAASQPSVTGRAIFVGRSARGPLAPTAVFGMAEFISTYGTRSSQSQALFDDVAAFFASGGSLAVIVRAADSATATRAAVTLAGTGGSITVAALDVGEGGNSFAAAWDAASKSLTVVVDGNSEVYSGTDLASVLAAASTSTTVRVTSSALPTAAVPSTTLSGGIDHYATATLDGLLALVPATFGPGAIVVSGLSWSETLGASTATVGATLAAHCAAQGERRVGIVTSPASVTTADAWEADKLALRALPNSHLLAPAWPAVSMPISTGTATVTVSASPAAVAAGVRSRAHGLIGPWASAIRDDLRSISAAAAIAADVTDTQAATAFTSGGILIRREVRPGATAFVIASWKTVSAPPGDVKKNLQGLNYRDVVAAITARAYEIGTGYEGVTPRSVADLATLEGQLKAMLEEFHEAGALFESKRSDGSISPAYVANTDASLNTEASLAAGLVRAAVRVRLAPSTEYVSIAIAAGDASVTL